MDNLESKKFPEIDKIKNILELFSILAISSLFFGFIIINSYLNKFGFLDFNIFRVRYIAAGFIFIFLFLAIIFPITFMYKYIKSNSESIFIRGKKFFVFITSSLVIWLTCALVFKFLEGIKTENFDVLFKIGTESLIWITFCIVSMWFFGIFFKKDFIFSNKDYSEYYVHLLFRSVYGILGVISILISVLFFASSIYPKISNSFGGGAPLKATILLNNEVKSFFPDVVIYDKNNNIIYNTEIIYQEPDSIFIKSNDKFYLINYSQIVGINYLSTK